MPKSLQQILILAHSDVDPRIFFSDTGFSYRFLKKNSYLYSEIEFVDIQQKMWLTRNISFYLNGSSKIFIANLGTDENLYGTLKILDNKGVQLSQKAREFLEAYPNELN